MPHDALAARRLFVVQALRHLCENMRDDLEFYITLLREVENNPVLYDHNYANYSNRAAAENAWAEIGEKVNEAGSACKSKWRNLRSTYIRYLHSKTGNRSGACPQKEYYLAPYFNFLKPFTKSRKPEHGLPESSVETTDNDSIEQICVKTEEIHYETEESQSYDEVRTYSPPTVTSAIPATNTYPSSPECVTSKHELADAHLQNEGVSSRNTALDLYMQASEFKRKSNDCGKCAVEMSSVKRKKLESAERDACELFLLSLVPRMQSMTEAQQLSFQIGVMQLMQKIKYSTAKGD